MGVINQLIARRPHLVWGFLLMGDTQNAWSMREKYFFKWMMTGGTPPQITFFTILPDGPDEKCETPRWYPMVIESSLSRCFTPDLSLFQGRPASGFPLRHLETPGQKSFVMADFGAARTHNLSHKVTGRCVLSIDFTLFWDGSRCTDVKIRIVQQ